MRVRWAIPFLSLVASVMLVAVSWARQSGAQTPDGARTSESLPSSESVAGPAGTSTHQPPSPGTTSPALAGERPARGDEAAPRAAPSAAPKAPSNRGQPDGGTFAVRLRDLEQRIDELKEQIRRSHTRLSLLSDAILSGGLGGARADITVLNELSDVFRLEKLLVLLDGAVQYNKSDEGGVLAEQERIPVFTGSIPPGDHTVQVLVKLRGHGYGVFSYLRGYHFEIKDTHSFTITEGKAIDLDIIVFEEGGMTTPVEERPKVRYSERVQSITETEGATRRVQPRRRIRESKRPSGDE